jgi:hypothetical protein
MVDSRCGRILAEGRRSMVSDDEFAWIEKQVGEPCDHLLIGTSLPWLLARALHDLEAWDEQLCDSRRRPLARFGEWLRRAADLEHWAAFHDSFERLGALLACVAERADAPATICVLSGDVHHAYVAEVEFDRPVRSRVYQLTCSPLHNYVPLPMKAAFRVFWSRVMERFLRVLLGVVAKVPRPSMTWRCLDGPYFSNEVAEFVSDGRNAHTTLSRSTGTPDTAHLDEVARLRLTA